MLQFPCIVLQIILKIIVKQSKSSQNDTNVIAKHDYSIRVIIIPYGVTVWRGEFDEFDESKLHRQNFPYQYFTFQWNNLSASTCNINGSLANVYWSRITSLSARSDEVTYTENKAMKLTLKHGHPRMCLVLTRTAKALFSDATNLQYR